MRNLGATNNLKNLNFNYVDITKPIVALFDFDGVIMDTESQYYIFWKEIGQRYFPEIKDFAQIIKGSTLVQIYDKYFAGKDAEQSEVTKALIAFEDNMKYNYVPGAEDFLRLLKDKGVHTAIITSSNLPKMAKVYAVHPELKTRVDYILTSEDFTRSKPFPDCFLLGAQKLNTVPENCVVFEDSFNGIKAGNSAEMNVIGLSTTNPREAIEDKCKLVISDFTHFSYEEMISVLD